MTLDELERDADRPKAPLVDELSDEDRASGRHLAAIHRMHLRNVEAVTELMAAIRDGIADPASLAPALARMPMAQNLSQFGTICGQECAMLQGHHDIEEHSIFPALRRGADEQLAAVIDRLMAEHEVIHALLAELEKAARELAKMPSDDHLAVVEAAFDPLLRAIRSHFGYEEVELESALGRSRLLG